MSQSRSKMISFRLSEGEYEALISQYRSFGVRNVSELARLALRRITLVPAVVEVDFAAKIAELDSRVHVLEARNSLLAESADSAADYDDATASEITMIRESQSWTARSTPRSPRGGDLR